MFSTKVDYIIDSCVCIVYDHRMCLKKGLIERDNIIDNKKTNNNHSFIIINKY